MTIETELGFSISKGTALESDLHESLEFTTNDAQFIGFWGYYDSQTITGLSLVTV